MTNMGYRDTYFNKNDAYDNNNGWYTCQKWQEVQKRRYGYRPYYSTKFEESSEWNLQCNKALFKTGKHE